MIEKTIQEDDPMTDLFTEAVALQGELTRNRRWLHTHPGVAFDIAETVEYVKQELENLGLSPVPCGRAGLTAFPVTKIKIYRL